MARVPIGDEIDLLTLLQVERRLSGEDKRLDRFSDDASTLSEPDTYNRCEDLGWIKTWHDHDASTSTVEITDDGLAALAKGKSP